MIIGVSSVILVGAAIEGLGVYAETSSAKAFGTDSYLIAQIAAVGRLDRKERLAKLRYNKQIRDEDISYLRETTGDRILYSPYRQRPDDVRRGEQVYEAATILGVSSSMPDIRDITLTDGRFFTEQEERSRQQLAVIGEEIRSQFFGASAGLGQILKIRGYDFTVIGIQEKLGSTFGRSQDNSVWIPASVFTRIYGPERSLAVFGRPKGDMEFDEALDLTRVALRSRFKARPGAPDNFDTLTPDSIRAFVGNILGIISAVVVPVTLISLVVGGIVIMNIMLVSVTERTREIGMRKSVGARRADIRLQFLVEAVIMSAAGGLLGLALGALVCSALSIALGIALPVSIPYVVLSIAISTIVGVVSGWYPSSRAASLDPVVALRAE